MTSLTLSKETFYPFLAKILDIAEISQNISVFLKNQQETIQLMPSSL